MKDSVKKKSKNTSPAGANNGGVYLVVADDGVEISSALQYASCMAARNQGHVGILYVITSGDFQHWAGVEERMQREMRIAAEELIWDAGRHVYEYSGKTPSIYIGEGDVKGDVITNIINEDTAIKMLVLAGRADASEPGPMINHFAGKGLAKLRVPVVIVPGHLNADAIEELTR